MKKVLILTTSYGHGHIATAQAIKEGLIKTSGQKISVSIVDFTDIISSLLNKTSKRMYSNTSKYIPKLYKLYFDITDTPTTTKAINELNYLFSRERILEFFRSQSPDLIICNSPHWQYIASLARQEELHHIPLISVITDSITIHVSWVVGDPDYYIVPNNDTANSLYQLGVGKSKVKVLGYPIKLEFIDKNYSRKKFLSSINLNPNKKVILILGAGVRLTSLKQTIYKLQKNIPNCQLIVATGKDNKIYPRLKSIFGPTIYLINWTNRMPEYIRSADLVITKAGGSTVMECIGVKKPTIINKIIPGQEEGNAQFVTKHKLGVVAIESDAIVLAAKSILNRPEKYNARFSDFAKPDASLKIAEFLLNTDNGS